MINLDKNFEAFFMQQLPAAYLTFSNFLRNSGSPTIYYLSLNGKQPNIQDIRELSNFFEVTDASDTYHKAVAGKDKAFNKLAIKMAGKMQSDLVSHLQRDYISQGMSRVRAMALEASNQYRVGKAGGPWQNAIAQSVLNLTTLKEGPNDE